MQDGKLDSPFRPPQFPPKKQPRVWFLTAANSPVAVAVAERLIRHGDKVIAGILSSQYEKHPECQAGFKSFLNEVRSEQEASKRLIVTNYEIREMGDCQRAIAEGIEAFGRIDVIFCCNSEALVGTVEELAQNHRTRAAIQGQFDSNFFGPVNIIKAGLPRLRDQRNGHIVLLTGITGHLGTPGLGFYCSSQWALEGYCDSLAYELAPFNVRVSIVQANIEVGVLTNPIVAAPAMAAYADEENPAPLSRQIIARLLERIERSGDHGEQAGESVSRTVLHGPNIAHLQASLSPPFQANLIAETVHAILAIGGHDNPPARHIVGHEGVTTVKEKLKTMSEELEEFVEVSTSVDL
ncbi:MAG: hypothetical protein M1831_002054 [Alyxoria varia]|nr:MAG: hypothetical protein M1831_002054 [Alyxoria varia]